VVCQHALADEETAAPVKGARKDAVLLKMKNIVVVLLEVTFAAVRACSESMVVF